MRYLLLLCLASLSCTKTQTLDKGYDCRSVLGTKVALIDDASRSLVADDCQAFSNQEFIILESVARVLGPEYHRRLLHVLPTTTVYVYPVDTIHPIRSIQAIGWTNCNGKVVLTEQRPKGSWNNSVLPHEYTHLAQGCNADIPAPNPDAGDDPLDLDQHSNWISTGAATIEEEVNTTSRND
jgi:hypothetical protein